MADGNQNIGGNVPSYRDTSPLGVDNEGRTRRRVVVVILVIIILLLFGLLGWWWFGVANKVPDSDKMMTGDTIEIPLGALQDGDVSLLGTGNLTMEGELNLQDGFVISPSSQPSSATPGQIYFDGSEIKYYNGSKFVSLATGDQISEVEQAVETVQEQVNEIEQTDTSPATGTGGGGVDFTPGGGLSLSDGVLSNTGVTALQGLTGNLNLIAGSGIAIDGLTVRNTGVKTITGGANIVVVNDGNGNITISSAGVTTPLEVNEGGTGTTSLANNGVVIGQGTNALTAVTAGGPGLCFVSTAGAPTFSACPNGGVTSLNTLTGDLTIANSSTAGSTITINDASTAQKGIAQFDAGNFSVTGGTVNTIQDIDTAATPTFAGVNTNNITPNGALTVGATGQSFTLQGSAASSITATSGANTTTVNFAAPTANRTITLPDESGTVCMQNSTNCGFASASDAFIQGGNDFGATAVLGTTGTNSLEIITDNTTRLTIDPTGAVSNQGTLRNAGSMAVGGNSSVSSNTLISLDQTYTSGTVTGVNGIIRLDPAAADSNYHTGMRYQLQTASGNVQNFTGGFRGITAFVEHNGTGTMNEAWGGEFSVNNSSTGTINSAVALRVQPNNNSGGGTILDNYGLFIDSQTAGTNSNYALYTNSGTVRFGDIVQAQTLGTADNNTFLCRNSSNQIAACSGTGSGASFAQGGNSFGATAVLGTNDANSLEIETNGATQATIAVGGATTFQNSADSTGAFRVLNAASVPQFQIDTTNSRVYIGNMTADGTGALLVLDTKNTAGDPTGVNGGMYYNSNAGRFRCFEAGTWVDCISTRQEQVVFTASGTFSKASYPGMRGVRVQVQAGGGGGMPADDTAASQTSAGGGGGGGAYAESFLTPDQLAASETVTVGGGGTARPCSWSQSDYGGDSSFGTLVTADGGGGAFLCMSGGTTASVSRAIGGEGGLTGTGDRVVPGTDGGNGIRIDGSSNGTSSGYGGNSALGKGGSAQGFQSFGDGTSSGYGGGGAGEYNVASQVEKLGFNGGPGIVIVTVYY